MTDDEIRKLVKDGIDQALAVHVYEKHKRRRSEEFKKPTRDELIAYCREEKIPLDVDNFLLTYERNGWMVGRSKMKSWQSAAQKAARDGWCRNIYASWMQKPKPKLQVPENPLTVEQRQALRKQMQGVGRPVERAKPVVATREMLNRLNEPIGQPSGPSPEFDLYMDPSDDDKWEVG